MDFSDEDAENGTSRPIKRRRDIVARQACEACRAKKTRCDQETPCGLCRGQDIQCVYVERKPTRNEASFATIMDHLKRMEMKIDQLSTERQIMDLGPDVSRNPTADAARAVSADITHQQLKSLRSPQSQFATISTHPSLVSAQLSFSAHQTIHWLGVQASLGGHLSTTIVQLSQSYPTNLELERPPFASTPAAQTRIPDEDWLLSLSLSTVKNLSDVYFETFNRIYPFIDRDFYFFNTLAIVVQEGFKTNIETCLVLNVMALGCMGVKAFEDGNFENERIRIFTGSVRQVVDEETPGSSLFNEARRRIGYCHGEGGSQSSQFYLTSALYFGQILRPIDQWMMTSRAATNCAMFWKCPPHDLSEWQSDIQSRIFWSALLIETIISQELELPPSRLRDLEDTVSLPRFIAFPQAGSSRHTSFDDSYYHYHFLAQVAHRIILSRIRDEIFYTDPSPALVEELRHQLEQWRANLPAKIWPANDDSDKFDSPAEAVAVSLLETRYRVSIFHLGRPFLHKILQNPSTATEHDLKICADALQSATNWPLVTRTCGKMKTFMPLKYFAAAQFFGQLFIFHAVKYAPDLRLQSILPTESSQWCSHILQYLADLSCYSPTISNDLQLLGTIYNSTTR